MLHKVEFENFYSFLGKVSIDFTVNKRVPETDAYTSAESGTRATKLFAIVGPNASGKTNLLKCIIFLDWFTRLSFIDSAPDDLLPFKPFLFRSQPKPSNFSIEFEIKGRIYRYEVILSQSQVLSEKLSVKTKGKKAKRLFYRIWDEKKRAYKLDLDNFSLPAGFSKLLRQNCSIISTAAQVKHAESLQITDYLKGIWTNINEEGKIHMDKQTTMLEYYSKNPKMREMAEEILGKFDFGFSRLKIDRYESQEKRHIYRGFGAHKHIDDSKNETLLPLNYESAGTKNLLSLLRIILEVLSNGGTAVIDEMEHDLHPLMIFEIVNLFTSKHYNPKNAQLVFSTHTAQILNKLDKQQVMFVEKRDGISDAWALANVKGVKADDNFYAKYMTGAYGGIPRL